MEKKKEFTKVSKSQLKELWSQVQLNFIKVYQSGLLKWNYVGGAKNNHVVLILSAFFSPFVRKKIKNKKNPTTNGTVIGIK